MENTSNLEKRNNIYLFILLALSYFVASFHRVSLTVLSASITNDLSISIEMIATLGSVLFFIYAIIQIPCGHLCDKFGPKYIILGSLMITAIGSLLFGMSNSSTGLLISRMVLSVGIATTYIPAISYIRVLFNNEKMGSFTGLLLASGTFGTVIASKPLQIFLNHFSWRNSFYIFSIISVILFILIALLVKNIKIETKVRKEKVSKIKGLGLDFLFVMLIVIFTSCAGAVQSFQGLWFVPYFAEGYSYTLNMSSNLFLIFSIGYFIGSPTMGFICDKVNTRKLVSIVSIFNGILWLFFGLEIVQVSGIFLYIVLFSLGFFSSGMVSIGFYYTGKYSRIDKRALITSILGFGSYMSTSILLKLMGIIVSKGNVVNMLKLNKLFLFYAALIITASFIFSYKSLKTSKI